VTDNFCSQCYKKRKEDKVKEEAEKKRKREEESKKKEEEANKIVVHQTDFTRCWKCNRHIGLLGFDCACGYKFCGKHRYPLEHTCPVDFKKKEKIVLEKNNQRVENPKLRDQI